MPLRNQQTLIVTDDHSLSADYLVATRDFAFSKGVSAATFLSGSGYSLESLLNPPSRIAHRTLQRMQTNMMQALNNDFETAVDFGRYMEVSTHGLLGMAIQSTSSLLEASELMLQYMKIRTSVQFAEIFPTDNFYWLRFTHHSQTRENTEHCLNVLFEVSILVSFDAIIKKLLRQHCLQGHSQMRMTINQPEHLPEYLQQIDSQISFDQRYVELGIPSSWMTLPLAQIDQELGQVAAQLCENELKNLLPKDMVSQLLETIQNIEGQKPSLKEVADQMHMSVSTLQRRLKEKGITFQELKAEARLQQAKQLLMDNQLALDDISSKLGFSDPSNFTKSFKAWTGQTPSAFRNNSQRT